MLGADETNARVEVASGELPAERPSGPPRKPACRIADRYDLLDVLGAGGMGVVYRARDDAGREVAVKLMRPEYVREELVRERLLREATAVRRITHPNVVAVLDAGEDPGLGPFVAFELLEGHSLSDRLEIHHRVSERRALEILDGVLAALDAAHAAGVVHRDLKPENIHLEGSKYALDAVTEGVKVLDFGISRLLADQADTDLRKLTRTGTVVGTPVYMAPEQALGDATQDHRADLYAAGVVLYEMLVGALPHEGENYNQIMARVLSQRPVPIRTRDPSIDERLAALVHRALEREPSDRFASAAEMREALRAYREARVHEAQRATPPRPAPRLTDLRACKETPLASITEVLGVARVRRRSIRAAVPFIVAAAVTVIVLLAGLAPRSTHAHALSYGALSRAAHVRARVDAEPVRAQTIEIRGRPPSSRPHVTTRTAIAPRTADRSSRTVVSRAHLRLIVANPYRSP